MSFWSQIASIDQKLDETSYYDLLGISATANSSEILDRYYKLASKLHPDRYVARSSKKELAALNRIHARMGEAKRVLLNAEQRAAYDKGLARGDMRLADTTDKPRKLSKRDPANPMARTLYEKAMGEIAAGSKSKAKANLTLAKQYEPGSRAIAEALAELEPRPAAEPTPPPAEPTPPPAEPTPPPAEPTPPPAEPTPPRAEPTPAQNKPSNRVHTRHNAVLPVRLHIATWERFEVLYTRDISRGGMFLKSTKAVPVGTLLDLKLMMPTGDTIEIRAEVVHCRSATTGRPSGMGLRFSKLSAETKALLDALMQNMPKPEPSPLSLEELVSELVRIRDLSPHKVLQIPENPSREEARVAYEKLARAFHPHRNNASNDPALFDICRELIGCVRLAYETITQP